MQFPTFSERDPLKNKTQPAGRGNAVADPLADLAPPPAGPRGWNNLSLTAGPQVNTHAFEGFNDDRALSGGDPNSVKDASRRFFGGVAGPTDTSKDGLDAWLTALIPQASEYGLNIQDVIGDQMLIDTAERGPEWIDYFRNAGGEGGGAFQWLPQADMQGGGGASGGGLGRLSSMPGGSDVFQALMANGGLESSDLMKRIQSELQEVLTPEAGPSPML